MTERMNRRRSEGTDTYRFNIRDALLAIEYWCCQHCHFVAMTLKDEALADDETDDTCTRTKKKAREGRILCHFMTNSPTPKTSLHGILKSKYAMIEELQEEVELGRHHQIQLNELQRERKLGNLEIQGQSRFPSQKSRKYGPNIVALFPLHDV